jgi:two-component sensor histidine kinase
VKTLFRHGFFNSKGATPAVPAFRLALIYFFIGSLWILFSDQILASLVPDPHEYARMQTLKGWFYVAVTSVLFGAFALTELRRLSAVRKLEAEIKLATALAEKDALMRELHHRVKNNLQLISSLVSLRSERVMDEGVRNLFVEFQTRIRAISAVQDRIYASGDMSRIDLGDLVKDLVAEFSTIYTTQVVIRFSCEVEGTVLVQVDRAVPIILTLTEILMNSVLHAFPGYDEGRVAVSVCRVGDRVHVRVADNGVGFDPDTISKDSTGLMIVKNLASQAGAQAVFEASSGVAKGSVFNLIVPDHPAPASVSAIVPG